HWQPVALVFAVLTGISLSIYWQFNGGAKIVPKTAGIESGTSIIDSTPGKTTVPDTIVANNLSDTRNVSGTAIPALQVPAPDFPSVRESQLEVEVQTESDPVNTDADTKLAAVTLEKSEKKLPAQNADTASATEDTPGTDKLYQQVTVILEKPGIETSTEPGNASTQSIEPDKPEPGVSLASIENTNTHSEPVRVSANGKETYPPLVGSPVAELSGDIKPDRQTNTRFTNASIASMPLATSLTSAPPGNVQNITKAKVKPFISNDDLRTLLFNLSTAYEMGNLQQLVRTFASDISSSDGSTRKQLENDYQRLFDITDTRRLAIRDVKWLKKDKQMLGDGDFQVLIREKGATNYTTYEGKISFTVAKESNNVVIKRLDYNYNN
ncbi:hypothetical protein, partial [Kaarinaea lacus]